MFILNQPFNGQLGEILKTKLQEQYSHLSIFSAFAKNSGVLRLKPSLEQFKNSGGHIEAFIGVDAHGTSYEAVLNLFELCDELYVIHSESSTTTFHSKVYMLSNNNNERWIAVGSNNLTGGGLWTNFESATCFETNHDGENCANELDDLITRYKDPTFDCSKHINEIADIDELRANDYLRSEMRIQMTTRTEGQRTPVNADNAQVPLFGTHTGIHIPRIGQRPTGTVIRTRSGHADVQAIMPIIANNDSERMWFETRSLTGGSRNILDLSKLGMVTNGSATGTRYETDNFSTILGGVAFFDIDPENTNDIKDITVNYNGSDYSFCTIKFAPDNGSWRIQLKGQNTDGVKIHKVGGEEWLRYKIIVFEKIRTDYYAMSVMNEDQLDNLQNQSRVVATNGSTANSKKYGLL